MTTLTITSRAPIGFFNLNAAVSTLMSMVETRAQRRALAQLDSAALNDIGLSDAQVSAEISRSFWDV